MVEPYNGAFGALRSPETPHGNAGEEQPTGRGEPGRFDLVRYSAMNAKARMSPTDGMSTLASGYWRPNIFLETIDEPPGAYSGLRASGWAN